MTDLKLVVVKPIGWYLDWFSGWATNMHTYITENPEDVVGFRQWFEEFAKEVSAFGDALGLAEAERARRAG